MAENDNDYFIVMECSSKNKGYKHAKVILTMGVCKIVMYIVEFL